MKTRIVSTGYGGRNLRSYLSKTARNTNPDSLGIAVAYISNYGMEFVARLVAKSAINNVRIVTDIGDAVTHPNAIKRALAEGWMVRAYSDSKKTFHSKYYLFGDDFNSDGRLGISKGLVVGSNNLSRRGLDFNYETSVQFEFNQATARPAEIFSEFWCNANAIDSAKLAEYETYFSSRNRTRHPADILALGAGDDTSGTSGASRGAMSATGATSAWAGLESFTGEYTFQLEFPRRAGEVLRRIFRQISSGHKMDILCEDGIIRPMGFAFYEDNSMFRLNIPNDVPGISLARDTHKGIALVEVDYKSNQIELKIVHNNRIKDHIKRRSQTLGSYGETPTRAYGWF